MTADRPNMVFSLASHILVGIVAPAWLLLHKQGEAQQQQPRGSLQIASGQGGRSSGVGQTPEAELALWLHAATSSLSDRNVRPPKMRMSRSQSLTISDPSGAASDSVQRYSEETWHAVTPTLDLASTAAAATAAAAAAAAQDTPRRRPHHLYGKSRQPGKSDSFTSLQSTEQSSTFGSVAWSQVDGEDRGTVSEGLETPSSRAQTGGSNGGLAYATSVQHLIWVASQAAEARGAPPAIAAHLAVIAVAASQAAGANLPQAALDIHALWLHSLSGPLATKRGLLHAKLAHTGTHSARTSTSQPGTGTSRASMHLDPATPSPTSGSQSTAAAAAAPTPPGGSPEGPEATCATHGGFNLGEARPGLDAQVAGAAAELFGSVVPTLEDTPAGVPWLPFDAAEQDPYGAYCSASLPDRARRLLELSTINEGSEPPPLAASAFSSDGDEAQQQPQHVAAAAEAEPRYQQTVRSISSLALRLSDAQQPQTAATSAPFGEAPKSLGADGGGLAVDGPSAHQQLLQQQQQAWRSCVAMHKSVPGLGKRPSPQASTSSDDAQLPAVSGWLAARRRRLQRSVSMSALALELDRHSHSSHLKLAGSSTSSQVPPAAASQSKRPAEGAQLLRVSDLPPSRPQSNSSAGRASDRAPPTASRRPAHAWDLTPPLDLLTASRPPPILPRHSNSSSAPGSARAGQHGSSPLTSTLQRPSHLPAAQHPVDALLRHSGAAAPAGAHQPVLSSSQTASSTHLPHSAPAASRGPAPVGHQGSLDRRSSPASQHPTTRPVIQIPGAAAGLPADTACAEHTHTAHTSAGRGGRHARQAATGSLEHLALDVPQHRHGRAHAGHLAQRRALDVIPSSDQTLQLCHRRRPDSSSTLQLLATTCALLHAVPWSSRRMTKAHPRQCSRTLHPAPQPQSPASATPISARLPPRQALSGDEIQAVAVEIATRPSCPTPQRRGSSRKCTPSADMRSQSCWKSSQPGRSPAGAPIAAASSSPLALASSSRVSRAPDGPPTPQHPLHQQLAPTPPAAGTHGLAPHSATHPASLPPSPPPPAPTGIAPSPTPGQPRSSTQPPPNAPPPQPQQPHTRPPTAAQAQSQGRASAPGLVPNRPSAALTPPDDRSSSDSDTLSPLVPRVQQPCADLGMHVGHRLPDPSARAPSFCFNAYAEAVEGDPAAPATSPPSYFHSSIPQPHPPTPVPPPPPPHRTQRRAAPGGPGALRPDPGPEPAALAPQIAVAAAVLPRLPSCASVTSSGSSRSPRRATPPRRHAADPRRESQSLSSSAGRDSPHTSIRSRDEGVRGASGTAGLGSPRTHVRGIDEGGRGVAVTAPNSPRALVANADILRLSHSSNRHSSDSLTSSRLDRDSRLDMFVAGGMSVSSGVDPATGKRRSAPYVPPSYRDPQVEYGQSGEAWEVSRSVLPGAGHSLQSSQSLAMSCRNTGRGAKDISTSSRLSNLDLNSWAAGACTPKPGVLGVTQVFGMEATRQLGGLSGTLQMEAEIEDCIIANRRLLDERRVLLDEVNIDKILGFGSMGIVYFGQLFDTKVVIKLIEHGTGVLGKEQNRGRLARVEAVISRLLLHPNIVTTYDCCTGPINSSRLANLAVGKKQGHGRNAAGRERCMTVIVQEYCVLGTLKDALVRKKAGLDPADAVFIPAVMHLALGIANGMKHLASLRIMHADLKAENVLLQKVAPTPENPLGLLAKVADFGLAQILPLNGEIKAGIHGTVSHMPPEAMKETIFSLATDVFSFGVVLWEMVTQEAPYRGMLPHEVVEAVCEDKKRLVWPPNTFPCLKQLAEDCWQEEPHSRPSFHQIVERLRAMVLRVACHLPERDSHASCSDDSDELEAALRAQKRSAGLQPPLRAVEGNDSDPDHLTHTHTSQLVGSNGNQGPETVASVMAQGFPRDPLGRILYLLCQMPASSLSTTVDMGLLILEKPGPLPGSTIWVTECQSEGTMV
ncbi:MAG: hypothetical protein WDW36_006463 [Sanguina aurantia]